MNLYIPFSDIWRNVRFASYKVTAWLTAAVLVAWWSVEAVLTVIAPAFVSTARLLPVGAASLKSNDDA